jgi:hypothetical protein
VSGIGDEQRKKLLAGSDTNFFSAGEALTAVTLHVYNKSHKCAHGAMKYWTVFMRKPQSECNILYIVLALLWLYFFHLCFAHFRVPLVTHLDHI